MTKEEKDLLAILGDTALVADVITTLPVFSIGLKAFTAGIAALEKRRLVRLRTVLEKKIKNNNIEMNRSEKVDPSVVANHIRITIQAALETDNLDKINFFANTYIHGLKSSFTSEDQTFIYLDICRRLSHLHISLLRDIYINRDAFLKTGNIQEIFDFLKSRNGAITEVDLFRFVFYDLNNIGLIRLSKDFLDFGSKGGYSMADEGISAFGTTNVGTGFIEFLELFPKEE